MFPALEYLDLPLRHVHPGWKPVLQSPDVYRHLVNIDQLLLKQLRQGRVIYPPRELIFHALAYHSPAEIRVVILGQDPYHGAGEAMGLSFSVPSMIKMPPSLRNIYKELLMDLGVETPPSGDLSGWAQQGVLLLNAVLTVEANRANSHHGLGWQAITDAIIDVINRENKACVFLLWGNAAQNKVPRLDKLRHNVLIAAHPSPLSAYRGFLGCRHFSQANAWLVARGKQPIEWG